MKRVLISHPSDVLADDELQFRGSYGGGMRSASVIISAAIIAAMAIYPLSSRTIIPGRAMFVLGIAAALGLTLAVFITGERWTNVTFHRVARCVEIGGKQFAFERVSLHVGKEGTGLTEDPWQYFLVMDVPGKSIRLLSSIDDDAVDRFWRELERWMKSDTAKDV